MDPFETLKKYLGGILAVPPLEWLHLVKILKIRKLEKDEFYFRQGDCVDEIGFVLSGLLYNFYTDSEGQDFVKYFVQEKGFVGSYSSLLQNIPANFTSQTLEPTTIITVKYKEIQNLFTRHVFWERLGRITAEKLYIEKEKREQAFLMADAKMRYEDFLRDNPGLEQRVPQYLIASYIGISPVSLSRIRKN